MAAGSTVYFLSDFHLGIPDKAASQDRERRIIQVLEKAQAEGATIVLLGDIFDFWFEWAHVVPRGHVRLLGKLAELRDAGVEIIAFTGNHDIWMFGYFEEELGIPVHREPQVFTWGGKRFLIGHGDGLGPGDTGFKLLKKLFTNRLAQWAFARLHPNLAMRIALYWSRHSRLVEGTDIPAYLGDDKEWLVQYCYQQQQQQHYDYFIFAHRHLPLDVPIGDNSRYINTGDWLRYDSYAVFDGTSLRLVVGNPPTNRPTGGSVAGGPALG